MLKMPFRMQTHRERAQTEAQAIIGRGQERAESLRRTLPEAGDLLDEAREQARLVLERIEELREQSQPAIDRGILAARQATADAALGLAHAAAPKRPRSKAPFVVVGLLVAGAIAFMVLRHRSKYITDAGSRSDEALAHGA